MSDYTASTRDESVFVRVGRDGHVVGVQLEAAAMRRSGHQIAQRVMACADAAWLASQTALRSEIAQTRISADSYATMPTQRDVDAAIAELSDL